MEIRPAVVEDAEACVAVLAALPEYFTLSSHDEARKGVPVHPTWVAEQDDAIIGFILAVRRFAGSAEITFAAVVPDQQNHGVGSALLAEAVDILAREGVGVVEVKTLDASSGYEPYIATRAFWERHGFVQIDCIDPLPGWDPGNPAAIYARGLQSTVTASAAHT